MKGTVRKLLALTLALCLGLGCLAACGQSAPASENAAGTSTEELDAVAQAAARLLPTHGSSEGKEETVYVIAGADGSVQRTIVSAWLKNPQEADTIADRAELREIQNVKGDESYTVQPDGSLLWDAQGRDIYYRGDSDRELPLTVSVDYKLDGKEIAPEELAGASGHLEMRFHYENKTGRREKIDGEDVTLYQPFVAVTCLVLDSAKASAVEVSSGTLLNSGEQILVAGLAMPGLKESLGLEKLEGEDREALEEALPDTITVTADVNDFSLLTTVTLVENALLGDLDLNDVDSFEELKGSIQDLQDASAQLVDGAGSLYDGARTLSGGTDTLAGGAAELDAGARTVAENMNALATGLGSLHEGAAAVSAGLNSLNDNVQALPAGVEQLKSGAESLKAALSGQFQTGARQLQTGAEDVQTGAARLQTGAEDIQTGALRLQTGAEDIQTGAVGLQAGAEELQAGALAIQAGADQILAQLDALQLPDLSSLAQSIAALSQALKGALGCNAQAEGAVGQLAAIQAALQESAPELAAQVGAVMQGASAALSGSDQYINGALAGLSGLQLPDMASLSSQIDAMKTALRQISAGAAAIAAGAKSGSMENPGLYEGAAAIAAGAKSGSAENPGLYEGAAAIAAGAKSGSTENPGLYEGAAAIAAGAKSGSAENPGLYEGAAALAAGVDTLISGNGGNNLDALIAGLESLSGSGQVLVDAVAQLDAGAADLEQGAKTSADGAGLLSTGTDSLAAGASQLNAGARSLSDGVVQLMDGASQLLNGMSQFDTDGVQVLSKLFEDDAQGFLDRLRALQSYGREYDSFSGLAEGTPGLVRFIIRTGSIGE